MKVMGQTREEERCLRSKITLLEAELEARGVSTEVWRRLRCPLVGSEATELGKVNERRLEAWGEGKKLGRLQEVLRHEEMRRLGKIRSVAGHEDLMLLRRV